MRQDLALVRAVQELLVADWLPQGDESPPEVASLREAAVPAQWHPRYYSAAIVGLYGTVEAFVSELTAESVRMLGKSADVYADLPEVVQREHILHSLRGALIAHERAADSEAVSEFVLRMASCFEPGPGFRLNEQVMASSSANFRSDVIRQVLSRVGVELDKTVGTDSRCVEALAGPLNGVHVDAHSVIDDLADRRNDVAHGQLPDDLLDLATLSAMLEAVEGYLSDVYRLAAQAVVRYCLPRRCRSAGQLHHSWTNTHTGRRSIAGVVVEDGVTIRVGSDVVVEGHLLRAASVLSIEREKVEQHELVGDGGVSYGLDVGVVVHSGEQIFVVEDEASDLVRAIAAVPPQSG